MPSVYLALTNNGQALPAFKEKNIANCMPGRVSDCNVYVETSFNLTTSFFKYFTLSAALKKPVDTMKELWSNVFKPISVSHQLERPVASFRFGELSNEQRGQLQAMGLQQDLTSKNLFIGSPDASHLAALTRLGPVEDRIRPGHLSYEAFFAWVYLMKGLQIYTSINNAIGVHFANVAVHPDGVVSPGASGRFVDMSGVEKEGENTTGAGYTPFIGTFGIYPPTIDISKFEGVFHNVKKDDANSVTHAVFFPYFRGLVLLDKDICFQVFNRLFYGLLAETHDSNVRLMTRIRSGCRQVAFSSVGLALSHIYKCIDLCEQVPGGKLKIVTNGTLYAGCFIEGRFKVHIQGICVSAGEIAEDIKRVNLLESTAAKIAEMVNGAENAAGVRPYNYQKEAFMNSRSAIGIFFTLDRSLYAMTDTIERIRLELEDMEFGDSFPNPTMGMIVDAVKYLSTQDSSILAKYPAYLLGGIPESDDLGVFRAMSLFGPKAPSFNIGDKKGLAFSIKLGKEDPNLVISESKERHLRYLPFWLQPSKVAMDDWTKFISTGNFYIPRPRKNRKEFTDLHRSIFQISSDPMFSEVYGLLKGVVNSYKIAGAGSSKRKRGDKSDSGKAKVQKMSSDADLL